MIASAIFTLGAAISMQFAHADTRQANCEVRKNGTGHNQGNGSPEYQRGYNDAVKGRPYDQSRHPQDCKDGYRAGEQGRYR